MYPHAVEMGFFDVECYNPDGSLAWTERVENGATTVGLNHILATEFAGGTQATTWYLGLISHTGFSAVAAADTMASHGGWTEHQDYNEATRPAWTPGSVSGGSITSSSTTNFTNTTANNQVDGVFLVSESTKGGSSGTLWATGLFASTRTLAAGQVLKINYTTTLG